MISTIIVDDEKAAIDVMETLLSDYPAIKIVGSFQKPLEAKEYIINHQVDVVIADIEMPEMNGFELLKQTAEKDCSYIFVTAHENHALYAFECNAFDYLTKPVNRERLNKSITKIENKYGTKAVKPEIKIQCFDVFKVFVGNEEIKFRTSKAQELIAYLMHRGGKSINRTEIADTLWNEFEGDKAIVNFNTTLSYIKKGFSALNVDFPITFDRGNYTVDMTNIRCDYLDFAELKIENEITDEKTAGEFESIISLYNGDYLAANDYPWAGNRRLILKDKYIRLLKAVSKYYYGVKNYDKVIEYMVRGFIITPLDTEIINRLIGTLVTAGNLSLAINYYNIYRESLKNELRMEPDTSLRQLLGI